MEPKTGHRDTELLDMARELEARQPQLAETLSEFRKMFGEYRRTRGERPSQARTVCQPFVEIFPQQR